jgi:flagellar biosynthetic protein FliS
MDRFALNNASSAAMSYREGVVQGNTSIGLLVLLYERLITDIRSAQAAALANETETRATHINHAFLVLQYLHGTLDFQNGAEAARQVERFYNHVRAKLMESQIRNSPEIMADQLKAISEVRDSWVQAEKILLEGSAMEESIAQPVVSEYGGETPSQTRGWRA